jgi:hypothetical protein
MPTPTASSPPNRILKVAGSWSFDFGDGVEAHALAVGEDRRRRNRLERAVGAGNLQPHAFGASIDGARGGDGVGAVQRVGDRLRRNAQHRQPRTVVGHVDGLVLRTDHFGLGDVGQRLDAVAQRFGVALEGGIGEAGPVTA